MSQLTCINCQVAFQSTTIQRDHYKTDWHRYNLKRKVAELPPVTNEEFRRRVLLVQQENEDETKSKKHTYCSVCKKSFASDHSFQNHSLSKKHTDLFKKVEDDKDVAQPSVKNLKPPSETLDFANQRCSDDEDSSVETASSGTEEIDSDEWNELISEDNPILKNDCLFCFHHSASLTKNVKHMSISHSFFIPHIEYLTDLKGLLLYLGEKICQGHICIWCNENKTSFNSVEAVRNHMIDKGHIKIPTDTESSLEYLDFYDFESKSDEEGDDIGLNENSKNISKKFFIEHSEATSMVLPSGDVISHRSLLRYFK